MLRALHAGGPGAAASLLGELAAHPELPSPFRTFVGALQAILAGSRDRTLADAPDLDYCMSAELLLDARGATVAGLRGPRRPNAHQSHPRVATSRERGTIAWLDGADLAPPMSIRPWRGEVPARGERETRAYAALARAWVQRGRVQAGLESVSGDARVHGGGRDACSGARASTTDQLQAPTGIDHCDEPAFRRATVALKRLHPEQYQYVFGDGRSAKSGPEAVGSVQVFLDRYAALRDGSDASRAEKKEADRAAAATLEARNIVNREIEGELRELIEVVKNPAPLPEPVPV